MLFLHIMICLLVVEGPSVEPCIRDEIVLIPRHKIVEIAIFQLEVDQLKGNVLLGRDYQLRLVIFSSELSLLQHINKPWKTNRKLHDVRIGLEELSFIFHKIDKLFLIHEISFKIVLVELEKNLVEDGGFTLYDGCVFDDKLSKFDIWFEVIVEVGKQPTMHFLTYRGSTVFNFAMEYSFKKLRGVKSLVYLSA